MFYVPRITPVRAVGGLRFMLSAAPQGRGDPMFEGDWATWGGLAAALRFVGTGEEDIEGARKRALEKGEGFSLPPMPLTDVQLRRLRLKRG